MQETEVNFKELYFYPPRCRYLDKQLLRCVKWLHNFKIYIEYREEFRIVYCQILLHIFNFVKRIFNNQ
jgi:hypothetical protein